MDALRQDFLFVPDGAQQGARSHAMREHWKRRRYEKKAAAQSGSSHTYRPIHPKGEIQATGLSIGSQPSSSRSYFTSVHSRAPTVAQSQPVSSEGIPAQALQGMNHVLSCGRLDPFDAFPVKFSAEHHKLIHHCKSVLPSILVHVDAAPVALHPQSGTLADSSRSGLSTYAAMVFDGNPVESFNPMLDVWFPLDLSNAASFNAIMAHAAAHLGMMQGKRHSYEALRYKAEAIRIVKEWMNEANGYPSDQALAAVVRLITYEVSQSTIDDAQNFRITTSPAILISECSVTGGMKLSGPCIAKACKA